MNEPTGSSQAMVASGSEAVCVVIPVHNPGPLLDRCLESLFASTGTEFTVVVVDDGSTDGFVGRALLRWPQLVVRLGDGDLWWSGAMNVGIQWARAAAFTYVLCLNHDCLVDPAAIAALVSQAHGRRALVGAKLLDLSRPEYLIGVGITFFRAGFIFHGAGQPDHGQYDHLRSVDMIDGHALLLPLSCLNEVGSFDEAAFPQYWGDVDLVLRARSQGWIVEVCPAAQVWNETSSTGLALGQAASFAEVRTILTSRRSHLNFRETIRFGRRHHSYLPWRRLLRRYQPSVESLCRHYLARGARRPNR